jgi:hypothetical protein
MMYMVKIKGSIAGIKLLNIFANFPERNTLGTYSMINSPGYPVGLLVED